MQATAADATSLDRLYDIVSPDAVPLWPPAPGWYVVAGVIVAVVAWGCWSAWRLWRAAAYRRAALGELAAIEQTAVDAEHLAQGIASLDALLKRTALAAFPRSTVASLSGVTWLRFLDETGDTTKFTKGSGQLLAELPYDPKAAANADLPKIRELFELASRWIRTHSSNKQLTTSPA